MILDKALKGIKVLDLTRLLPGLLCTRYLCDMGAEIIKIEDPHQGDYAKHYPPLDENGVGVLYQKLNHSKQIITLDLKEAKDKESFEKMVSEADVIVESFRPGVMDKLGIGFNSLRKINPQIILCSISGYGQNDSFKDHPGHDLNYMGYSGLLSTLKTNEGIPVPGFQMADIAGGSMMGHSSILGALHQVRQTQEALHLDISMTHTLIPFLSIIKNQKESGAPGIITGESACYSVYETKDHLYMALGAMEKKFWIEFCDRVGKQEWIERHPGIGKEFSLLQKDLKDLIGSKTQSEWSELFKDGAACFTPVKEVEDSYLSRSSLDFPL